MTALAIAGTACPHDSRYSGEHVEATTAPAAIDAAASPTSPAPKPSPSRKPWTSSPHRSAAVRPARSAQSQLTQLAHRDVDKFAGGDR